MRNELLVSDDASDDRTVAVLRAFGATAPFPVRVTVGPERLGVAGNFERAIGEATGDIIVLADQDDVWVPEKLDRLERTFLQQPSAGMAFSDAFLIDTAGRRSGARLWDIAGFGTVQRQRMRDDAFGRLMSRFIVAGCTMAFRSSYRPLVTPFPASLVFAHSGMRVLHDGWIAIAIAAVSDVAVIDEPLIEYRIHDEQTVGIPSLWLRRLVPTQLMRWRAAAVPTREYRARLEGMMTLLGVIISLYLAGTSEDRMGMWKSPSTSANWPIYS